MAKTLRFEVVIADVPDWMPEATVVSQLEREITHPYDAAFDANIDVYPMGEEIPEG